VNAGGVGIRVASTALDAFAMRGGIGGVLIT